jgi:hypothetical protein
VSCLGSVDRARGHRCARAGRGRDRIGARRLRFLDGPSLTCPPPRPVARLGIPRPKGPPWPLPPHQLAGSPSGSTPTKTAMSRPQSTTAATCWPPPRPPRRSTGASSCWPGPRRTVASTGSGSRHRRLRRWPGPLPARRRPPGRRGRSAQPADPTPPGQVRPIDAEAAARAALAGTASGSPKARDGAVEAIRALRVARRSALKARTRLPTSSTPWSSAPQNRCAVSCGRWLPLPGSHGSPPGGAGRRQPTRSRRPSWPCGSSPGATRP